MSDNVPPEAHNSLVRIYAALNQPIPNGVSEDCLFVRFCANALGQGWEILRQDWPCDDILRDEGVEVRPPRNIVLRMPCGTEVIVELEAILDSDPAAIEEKRKALEFRCWANLASWRRESTTVPLILTAEYSNLEFMVHAGSRL